MPTALWPLVGIVCVGVISGMYLVLRPKSALSPPTVTRCFYCPLRERRVRVDFRTAPDGRIVGVVGCSACTPPTVLMCGEFCLRPTELPPTRVRTAAVSG
jgi:hypothetical protein